jgi:hypothetical protein
MAESWGRVLQRVGASLKPGLCPLPLFVLVRSLASMGDRCVRLAGGGEEGGADACISPRTFDSYWASSLEALSGYSLATSCGPLGTCIPNLFIPGHSSDHRFQCICMHEEADTVTLQDVMGVSVRIYLHPKAGHSTSVNRKDVLFLNFPAASDIHQLRALLTCTPLCEIHGSSRSAIHR